LNPRVLGEVYTDLLRVAQAAGAEAAAANVLRDLKGRVDAVRHKVRSAGRPPLRVACLEWIDPPMLAANWMPDLIHLAGGRQPRMAAGQHSTYADWTEIAEFSPQVIVIMPCGFDLERTIAEAQVLPGVPGWSTLVAVLEGRVFAADGNAYFNRSGPRLVDSLQILAHLFHPELFPPPLAEPQQAWRRLVSRAGALVPEEP